MINVFTSFDYWLKSLPRLCMNGEVGAGGVRLNQITIRPSRLQRSTVHLQTWENIQRLRKHSNSQNFVKPVIRWRNYLFNWIYHNYYLNTLNWINVVKIREEFFVVELISIKYTVNQNQIKLKQKRKLVWGNPI